MPKPAEIGGLPRVSPWLTTILRPIHAIFVPSYFRLRVEGQEHIPKTGPVILAPTHRSRWDPIVLACLTRRTLRFMASHDEFVGVQGWFMRRLGAFPVNTRRPSAGTIKTCENVLLSRDVLVIFPEGGIFYYPPDHVHPLKPGTAWLALKVQQEMPQTPLPIVPVRIRYSQPKPKFRTGVHLVAKPPIDVSAYAGGDEREAIRELTERIQNALGDIVNTSTAERGPDRTPVKVEGSPQGEN